MSQKEGGKDYEFMNHFQSAVSNLRFLSVHTTFESNFLSNSPHFFFFSGQNPGHKICPVYVKGRWGWERPGLERCRRDSRFRMCQAHPVT